MANGTFVLTGTLVNSGSSTATPVGAATLKLCAAIDADSEYISFASGAGTSYVVRVDPTTTSWVLTGPGAGTYAFASLPSGFTVLSAQLNYGGAGASATNFYGGSDAFCNANSIASVEFDILTTRALIRASGVVSPASPFIDSRFPGHSALSLNNNGYGIRFSCSGNGVSFEDDLLTITGTYTIVSTSWALPSSAKAGDKVSITGPSGLDQIGQIHIQYNSYDRTVLAQDFITQTPTLLQFWFPEFGNFSGTVYLYASLYYEIGRTLSVSGSGQDAGIQFFGSVLIGTLTVTFADASGVYILVPYKTTDTIYTPGSRGTTTDVNIPDPFIKTGFIP